MSVSAPPCSASGAESGTHESSPMPGAPMKYDALILDLDGVLLESEYAGNKQIADWLTDAGHPTSVEDAMHHFMGLAGTAFIAAIERWIGRPLPDSFHAARKEEDLRALAEGLEEVQGAVAFIRG